MDVQVRTKSPVMKFTIKMQKKLLVLFAIILASFVGLSAQLYMITRDNGETYKKQVLSQQEYDSVTIPFKRGNIVDSNGTVLAVSNKVYNVILDTKILMRDEKNACSWHFSHTFTVEYQPSALHSHYSRLKRKQSALPLRTASPVPELPLS